MRTALLVDYYNALPKPKDGEDPERWALRLQTALEKFRAEVADRYSEGTLQRLLACADVDARRAAVLSLGLIGQLPCNEAVARRLHDEDPLVRQLATDALWAIWFRGDSDTHNNELQRLMSQRDGRKALAGYADLLKRAPKFAEAYNQRAVLHFRLGEYQKSITDCEKTVQLNPFHFGALSGMAQCYMKLKKPRAALKAYRHTYRINPNLQGVEEAIRALEQLLGEEGRKEDK